jgi:hypothetical protein
MLLKSYKPHSSFLAQMYAVLHVHYFMSICLSPRPPVSLIFSLVSITKDQLFFNIFFIVQCINILFVYNIISKMAIYDDVCLIFEAVLIGIFFPVSRLSSLDII